MYTGYLEYNNQVLSTPPCKTPDRASDILDMIISYVGMNDGEYTTQIVEHN